MSSLDRVFIRLLELLKDQKKKYMMIGGLAVGVVGEARMTQDIDVLIMIEKKDIPHFLQRARSKGFEFKKKELLNTIELQGFFKLFLGQFHIDFIIGSMPFELSAFSRRKRIKLFNHTVYFPSPEDLILLKMISSREKDLLDARSIVLRHKNKLNKKYLEKWAEVIADDLQDTQLWDRLQNLLRDDIIR